MRILNDNYFTYRQTPVDYDGIAKIESIKGNSVAWNQLVQNGNFADTSNWNRTRFTLSASGNVLTATCSETNTGKGARVWQVLNINDTHNRLYKAEVKGINGKQIFMATHTSDSASATNVDSITSNGNWQTIQGIANLNNSYLLIGYQDGSTSGDILQIKNVMCIDLTQLNDSRITDYASFSQYYPLPYYSYTLGTLVSFNGTGIKTVGKNLLYNIRGNVNISGVVVTANSDGSITAKGLANSNNVYCFNSVSNAFTYSLPKGTYTFSMGNVVQNDMQIGVQRGGNTTYYYTDGNGTVDVSVEDTDLLRVSLYVRNGLNYDATFYPMVRKTGASADYEPYTEKSASLPISSYFPTGMKSANTVYDEISNGNVVTRIGAVDLGSLTWTYQNENSHNNFYSNGLNGLMKMPPNNDTEANITCKYETTTRNKLNAGTVLKSVAVAPNYGLLWINDDSYTDAITFKTAMSGQYLFFELATPLENYGVVDLGSLSWTYDSSVPRFYASAPSNAKVVSSSSSVAHMICDSYLTVSIDTLYTNVTNVMAMSTGGVISIKTSAYSDSATFTTAMSGVYLLYEKTTTEKTIKDDISYFFFDKGTEQLLPVNTSTPSTTLLLADIIYYDTREGETPYRKFWMINTKGERWNLTERDFKSFLNNPQNLGYSKTITVNRYGNAQNLVDVTDNFPQPSGEIIFYDSANSSRYEKYNRLIDFLSYYPITLYYQLPFTFFSQIPNIYTLECVAVSLGKTESKTDGMMTCPITFNGLSFYKGDTVEINGSGSTYTLNNEGDFPVGFEITIKGTLNNPYFTLEQDGELYGEAKFDDSTAFGEVYVDSIDGEQNIILKQGGSVLANPLGYRDLSISNGSIYVTFVKLQRGESTLTIGYDSGSITSVDVSFTPIYRSV